MNNEKITFNATAGLQVISDIIQVSNTYKVIQHESWIFQVQVKSLTAGKINKYDTIMWKMALKRLPNVGLENERLG